MIQFGQAGIRSNKQAFVRQHSSSSVLFECVGMFVRGHVLIYLAACMCVVALEGGHRHKEKKN